MVRSTVPKFIQYTYIVYNSTSTYCWYAHTVECRWFKSMAMSLKKEDSNQEQV